MNRRESDRQDIRVLPLSGALIDRNALRALEQSWVKPVTELRRLSESDPACIAVAEELKARSGRGMAA